LKEIHFVLLRSGCTHFEWGTLAAGSFAIVVLLPDLVKSSERHVQSWSGFALKDPDWSEEDPGFSLVGPAKPKRRVGWWPAGYETACQGAARNQLSHGRDHILVQAEMDSVTPQDFLFNFLCRL
jgi:hypothetical protein